MPITPAQRAAPTDVPPKRQAKAMPTNHYRIISAHK
jgi:hypothetical protein